MSQLTIDKLKKSAEEVIQSAEELEQRYHLEYKKLHSKRFWGWLGAFCIFLTVALVGPALENRRPNSCGDWPLLRFL